MNVEINKMLVQIREMEMALREMKVAIKEKAFESKGNCKRTGIIIRFNQVKRG